MYNTLRNIWIPGVMLYSMFYVCCTGERKGFHAMFQLTVDSPIQVRGPSPKGINAFALNPLLPSRNRSGSNFMGFGKYFGSLWNPKIDINSCVSFSMTISLSGILNDFVHIRLRRGSAGYLRTVSNKDSFKKMKTSVIFR